MFANPNMESVTNYQKTLVIAHLELPLVQQENPIIHAKMEHAALMLMDNLPQNQTVTQLVLFHVKVAMEIVTDNAKMQILKSVMNIKMINAQMEVPFVITVFNITHVKEPHVKLMLVENSPACQNVKQLVLTHALDVMEEVQVNAKVTRTSVIITKITNAHKEVQYVLQQVQNIHA